MAQNIKNFSDVVAKKLGYYVYRLIDPRNGHSFYVGKGKGNRVFAHVNDALSFAPSDEEDAVSAKIETIRNIKAAGLEVMHIIHRHGMDEATAFEVEAALIDAYPGLANEMRGHYAAHGAADALQLQQLYDAPLMPESPAHKLLVIKTKWETIDGQGSVYEAVRKSWRIDETRAKQADYVLGVINGLCHGVFIAEQWHNFPGGRRGFEGHEAPQEIQELYIGHRLPDKIRRQQNPIGYINC